MSQSIGYRLVFFWGILRKTRGQTIIEHREMAGLNNANMMLTARNTLKKVRNSRSLRLARLAIPATNKVLA